MKRILVALAGLTLLLVALRLWWGWEAHRRLRAEIERIIAAGEPIYPEDFDPAEDVPDDQNAAHFLRRAGELFSAREQTRVIHRMAWRGRSIEDLRTAVEENGEVLGLVRQAREARRIEWGPRMRSPVTASLRASRVNLLEQHQLSGFLASAAWYYQQTGYDAGAIQVLRDAVAQIDALSMSCPTYGHFFSLAEIEEDTYRCIQSITVEGTVSEHWAESQLLLGELLDEHALSDGFHRGMLRERMMTLDGIRTSGSQFSPIAYPGFARSGLFKTIWERGTRTAVGPLGDVKAVIFVRYWSQMAGAARADNWPACAALFPSQLKYARLHELLVAPPAGRAADFNRELFATHFLRLAQRRMTAILLAMRFYEADHGRRPSKLSELVPTYLLHVPADPFSTTGDPIGFQNTGLQRFLYTLGPDPPARSSAGAGASPAKGWPLDLLVFVDRAIY